MNEQSTREKIEQKLTNERKKEGEQKLEKLLREINDAKSIVEAKEQQAADIIEDYGLV